MAGTADDERPLTQQLIIGAGSGGTMQAAQAVVPGADLYWLRTQSPFACLRQLDVGVAEAAAGEGESSDDKLVDQLKQAKSMDEASSAAQELLLARVDKIMSVPVTDINTAKPVHTYGTDSLTAVELRNWLAKQLRSDLSIFDLTSSTPISELSRKIASRSRWVSTAAKGQVKKAA